MDKRLPLLLVLQAAAAAPPTPLAQPLPAQAGRPGPDPAVLVPIPNLSAKATLLPAGHTQGTFRLNGLVRPNRTVLLRWANDQGEMPTEGVIVSRQKVGDSSWKELNRSAPVAFFQTRGLASRFARLPRDKQETLMAMVYGNLGRDPGTGRRLALPASPAKGAPTRSGDLRFDHIAGQFRTLRRAGALGVPDLQLLSAHADLDPDAADAFGLSYVDDPPSGQYRYKITVKLPEGGTVEAVCPKTFDRSLPTPVAAPAGLSAASGNGSVLLNWQPGPGDVVAGYNIYRQPAGGGSFRRVNAVPVKLVTVTARDPAATLQDALAQGSVIARETRQVPAGQMTAAKAAQIRAVAADTAAPAPLPADAARTVQSALAAGQLHPAGPARVLAAYTDRTSDPGNSDFVNQRSYLYKVVPVDIGGQEGAGAATVAGMPRNLQPPAVPGSPDLSRAFQARQQLLTAVQGQSRDPGLVQANQAVAGKSLRVAAVEAGPLFATTQAKPAPTRAVPAKPAPAPLVLKPEVAALSLADAKRLRLSRLVSTLPAKAMAGLTAATALYSLADGSAPPANLVWAPSTGPDLAFYTIYRGSGSTPLARAATSASPSWTDSTLQVGQSYTYAISATDHLGNESAQSPARMVNVYDSALGAKLAIRSAAATVATTPPPVVQQRFLHPVQMVVPSTSLADLKPAGKPLALAGKPVVAGYRAPAAASLRVAPDPVLLRGPAPAAGPAAPAKVLDVQPADLGSLRVQVHATVVHPLPARFPNPMLTPPVPPTEIYVQLTWTAPTVSFPLEYTVCEAPQSSQVSQAARGPVRFQPASFHETVATAARSVPAPSQVQALPQPNPLPVVQASPGRPPEGTVQTTSAKYQAVAGRTVPGASVLAADRLSTMAVLNWRTGPGTFSLITPKPLTAPAMTVSFPVDAAQYGGASFYFQVQAHARELDRVVDGPVSDPIKADLPDLVPPPMPAPGSVLLRQEPSGALDVALAWTQTVVPDLAGTLVDRQPMAYQVVQGLASATTPLGQAQRLTPSPAAGLAYTDPAVPGGYYRYTFHSADHAGNVSATQNHLDILVPGEPAPSAPQGVLLAGTRLSWQAATHAAGYTVWRAPSADGGYDCISPILGGSASSWDLPQPGGFLKVVARSPSGMYQAASAAVQGP